MRRVSQLAEGDFAKQAQLTAAQLARQAQLAGKNASDGFNKFVEGPEGKKEPQGDASRRGFWDDFSNIAAQRKPSTSAIGTSAMGMGKSRTGAGAGAGGAGAAAPAQKQPHSDEWDDW